MAVRYDIHMHSDFSTDSQTPMEKQILRAKELGLAGICFTDHMDYEFPPDALDEPCDGIPFEFDVSSYLEKIRLLREKNPDFELMTGVECGLKTTDSVIRKNCALVKNHADDWDLVIGSLHLIHDKDPYYPSFWEGQSPENCIREYFSSMLSCLGAFHDFDTLGHMDYIVRYAPEGFVYDPADYQDITDEILKFLIRKDIALEINSSGLSSASGCVNPHPDLLRRYTSLGGSLVTIGADAHVPERIALGFSEVETICQASGLHGYVTFSKRRPVFHEF